MGSFVGSISAGSKIIVASKGISRAEAMRQWVSVLEGASETGTRGRRKEKDAKHEREKKITCCTRAKEIEA